MIDRVREALRTAIGFPVTTFDRELRLDLSGTQRHVENMIDGGMRTLVCAGGAGELYALSPDECERVYRATVEAAAGRAVVLAGVGFGIAAGADLARAARAAGCDGLLIMPPYFTLGDERGWIDYYRLVAGATDLPCSIYLRDNIRLTGASLSALCSEAPNVVGVKDGSGNIRAFEELRHAVGDRLVWLCGIGDDWAPSYFAAGAEGFTSSVSNFDPRLALQLFELCRSGDARAAADFVDRSIRPFFSLRLRGYDIALTKAAAELAGLPGGPVRPPAPRLTDEHRRQLADDLRAAGLIGSAAPTPTPVG